MNSSSCKNDIYTSNFTIYNNSNDTTFVIESNNYKNTFTTDTSGNLMIDSSYNITITAVNTLTVDANIDASGRDISCNVLNYTTLNPIPAGGGNVSTNATNTYTNLSINYFDDAQFCAGTLQLKNYNSTSSIPQGQIGISYNGIACVNNLPYFYPENANPYLDISWNALALQSNYTYINPTLSGTTNIGTSFTGNTLNMQTTNFYTSQPWRNTILNSPIYSGYTGQFNTIVGYSPTTTNITSGSNNTIVGSSNEIQFNCSDSVILGNSNTIQSGTNNGAIGNGNILTNNNTIVIANNYTTTADNQIVLGSEYQIPFTQSGFFAFNPIYTFLDPSNSYPPLELYSNMIGSDHNTNNLYGYDGAYWNRLTQKNAPFGYINEEGLSAMNITFTWNPYASGSVVPLSLFTLHMNFVYTIVDTSNNPYTTTTIMVSGAIVTIDLYAIMSQQNDASFNSAQSSNTVNGNYCNGYADIGMIKILQPSGSNWASTYSGYPILQANTVTYDLTTNLGTLGLTLYPADISSQFPTSYQTSCVGVIEIKCDNFMPSPYQSQFTFSTMPYPTQ